MTELENRKHRALAIYGQLTGNAQEVLGQLFISGPTWDGNISSKVGRADLINQNLARRIDGWTYLTEDGVIASISVNVRSHQNTRWRDKQNCR